MLKIIQACVQWALIKWFSILLAVNHDNQFGNYDDQSRNLLSLFSVFRVVDKFLINVCELLEPFWLSVAKAYQMPLEFMFVIELELFITYLSFKLVVSEYDTYLAFNMSVF